MPTFTSPDSFKDHKAYVPLLKKALQVVKPETPKKFLYFKQYTFGAKKLPLVLVDFDANCLSALAKAGQKPTAEGAVSLTTKDELNFEANKGSLKRISLRKYFDTLGTGIKPVFVPEGETDEEDGAKGAGASQPNPTDQLLQRIEALRAQSFPPAVEKLKGQALDKAKALAQAGKLADATLLVNQLAAKATPASTGAPTSAEPQPAARPGTVDLKALKWTRWFIEKPLWPDSMTKATWDKNKSAVAKLTLATGIGEQLKACEAAFQAAVSSMPFCRGVSTEQITKSTDACKAFLNGGPVKALHESLKTLRDVANQAAAECKKSLLIPKSTTQLCTDIATSADFLMVTCNPNSLSGFLAEALKANDAKSKAWRLDDLKAEKNVEKRIELCVDLLEQNADQSPQRALVEDMLAEAKKEWGVNQAKAAYATQMKGEVHEGDAQTPAYNPGGKFDLKNLAQRKLIFDDPKVQKLMKDTGLTEGEVLAIRAYTASNYQYINPAIANQKDRTDKGGKDWMDTQNRPDPSEAKTPEERDQLEAALKTYLEGKADQQGSKKGLYEEGALHAGMMAEAFKKLPKISKTLYRGARMTPAAFQKAYAVGQEITYEAFVSQTTAERVARGFASGGGDFPPPRDATTSVMALAQVTDARDVMALSVYGDGEKELLVPPGTKLRVEKIENDAKREVGDPPAKEWKVVTLKQIVK